ncbi:hypothetical protein MTX78_15775 [Hymenobacter tibetensis]|uniref:Uncharacterized protein n=1 Tax=Hymenobacter tibetensis TaxID=497967 RepID=A0ABY4CTJ3_9BACT|nr:hypothetical protein [Hymenobacter tibetensis]UOG73579.1 hypothetical protein MTX78_15775 [Hymenobacter tibetensis]
MATTKAPADTDQPLDERSTNAAQGKQDGGVVGQSSGRPSYGTGGYELNLDAEAGDEGGSGSASSSTSKAPHESSEDDK